MMRMSSLNLEATFVLNGLSIRLIVSDSEIGMIGCSTAIDAAHNCWSVGGDSVLIYVSQWTNGAK